MPSYHFRSTPLETDSRQKWHYTITFSDDNGAPIDITGWDFEMQGRRKYGASDPPYFAVSTGAGITNGTSAVTPFISDEILGAIRGGDYVWELRGENASGEGEITVKGPWHHHAGVVD
jgi:hypothetical protein